MNQNSIPTGSVMQTLTPIAPDGWLALDGSIHQKTDFPELWGIMDTIGGYEVDQDQFSLPNMDGNVLMGDLSGIGQVAGTNEVSLTVSQMPSHSHGAIGTVIGSGTEGNNDGCEGNIHATAEGDIYIDPSAVLDTPMKSGNVLVQVADTGGGAPVVLPEVPHLKVMHIIKT
ncbi:MAG: tail fiber protein [Bacteroidota bacterium]